MSATPGGHEVEAAAAAQGAAPPDPRAAGLTSAEAAAALAHAGPSTIAAAPRGSHAKRFASNLVHLFALLLWTGALLALVGGLPELAIAIVAVILVNAVFAFVQEYRAERAVEALRRMLPARVRVRRDGDATEILTEEVVPGDVLLLAPGDRVAADADLLATRDLRVDESTLTGESQPVQPTGAVFAGTYVTGGLAEAAVTATGMSTRFGRIAELAQRTGRARSTLELQLDRVTRLVAFLALGIGLAFFFVAGLLGMSVSDRFVFAVGVTVALVPEGLLPTVTLALALATQRMARRNALVRRLSSVETLGETTVICSDKTGTLTANEMTVQRVWTPAGAVSVEGAGYEPFGRFRADGRVVETTGLTELLRAALLCNDARLVQSEGDWRIVGDPTEGALVVLAEKAGLHHSREAGRSPRVFEFPFSSERKRMTTLHVSGGDRIAYVKGAPEVVVPLTSLDPPGREQALGAAAELERQALRVLALARRTLSPETGESATEIEQELEFLGVVGMLDPPHPEVPDAVRRCRKAGIRVIMVTGDSGRTEEADIGVAMGRTGTDVAKEAADMVLLDDNFASVVAAVEEGRAVYDNIRRFAGYHFCSNVGELVPFLVWGVTGGAVPLPLVVMQVLAIDLGTDMVPAIALGAERAEPGTMSRPPRPRGERLLDARTLGRTFGWIGPLEGLAAMAGFFFAYGLAGWIPGEPLADSGELYLQATTMTMAGIVMAQIGAGIAWRTNRRSIAEVGLFTNPLLLAGIALELAMVALLAYTPGLNRLFHTSGLEAWHWFFLLLWPPVVLGAEELRKAFVRRRLRRFAPEERSS